MFQKIYISAYKAGGLRVVTGGYACIQMQMTVNQSVRDSGEKWSALNRFNKNTNTRVPYDEGNKR